MPHMTTRPTITPGQVWRRPSGLHVLVVAISSQRAELTDVILVQGLGSGRLAWARQGSRTYQKALSAIGGGKWELVAEGVRDPMSESQPA